MTQAWKRIYKENIVGILAELADKNYQKKRWLNLEHIPGMTLSFVEASCMLLDDCVIGDYLKEGEILFDRRTTEALRSLKEAISAVDEFRPEEDIIDDPLMEIVRQKSAAVLFLINISTGEGSTVDIAAPGQSSPQ